MAKKQLTRFEKARRLISINGIKITDTDPKGRVKSAFVNGSQAKTYQVILKRNRVPETVVAECLLQTGNGHIPCPSSQYIICYHVLATVIKSAEENGMRVLFTASRESAEKLLNFGGEMFQLVSEREGGNNPTWVVTNPK